MELMEHDFVSWDALSAAFIKKVSAFCRFHSPCPWDSLLPLSPRLSLLLTDGFVSCR